MPTARSQVTVGSDGLLRWCAVHPLLASEGLVSGPEASEWAFPALTSYPSQRISRAALYPHAPITPPPGWVAAPHM